jgi:hypothetical protein
MASVVERSVKRIGRKAGALPWKISRKAVKKSSWLLRIIVVAVAVYIFAPFQWTLLLMWNAAIFSWVTYGCWHSIQPEHPFTVRWAFGWLVKWALIYFGGRFVILVVRL